MSACCMPVQGNSEESADQIQHCSHHQSALGVGVRMGARRRCLHVVLPVGRGLEQYDGSLDRSQHHLHYQSS